MIRTYQARRALFPKHVFRTSRASRPRVDNNYLVLEQDGRLGYGEASPNSFFKEDPSDVQVTLAGLSDYFHKQTLRTFGDIARIWEEVWHLAAPSRACQCAVDIALWDLWAKLQGQTAAEIAFGRVAREIPTSATLGICPPEEWEDRIREIADFPSVKVKLDARADLEILKAIRKRSDAVIRVDANCAWSALSDSEIGPLSERLAALGVEFIEQPLPPSEDGRMESLLRRSCLPILADESCAGLGDIARLQGRFSGFNIKLVKCGGITPALAMLRKGQELGLKTMVGCMLESSLLISAGVIVAQEADYADLDGSWLLQEDPFEGLAYVNGRIRTVWAPGLGIEPKPPKD